MNPLQKKLRLNKAKKVILLQEPHGYRELLGKLPEGVIEIRAEQAPLEEKHSFDFVHLFVTSIADLEQHAFVALNAISEDGLFWVSYPKKSSKIKTDIHRDHGWDVIHEAGLVGIASIAIDDTWSAIRFRPAHLVAKK